MLDAPDIAAICRVHGIAAVDRLVRALDGEDVAASVRAAEVLLAYAYGQPLQPLSLDAGGLHIALTTPSDAEQSHRLNGEGRDDKRQQ